MKLLHWFTPLLFIVLLASCSGDYRPKSIGAVDEVIVVMDSTQWNSDTAMAIRETFGGLIETVPTPENAYDLTFRDFKNNRQLEQLKEFKNVIFAGPIGDSTNVSRFINGILSDEVEGRVRAGESFAFPLRDQWVRDQWTLILTSTSDEALAENIVNSEEELVGHLREREFERRKENIYRRGEQVAISDSLWEEHGWKVRMQHDYIQVIDTTDAVMFRRYLPDNNRWMWAWWQDGVDSADFINREWINAKRDSLMEQLVQGEREGSYVTTDYRRPLEMREIDREDRLMGFETKGLWRMTNDYMGGPFVHFTYYDPLTDRLFMVEYAQFAPSVKKRRFVRQFQTMGRTFESDSTWNQPESSGSTAP
ncbi:MAG: DUF4837 family protein [Bacteroidetes bacterium]|jgi:hypothetical protein|nr:DUF4837 family protein [Bacteroidota bacterium]